jgi:tetratricopeptide (TPR) repeat protein
MRTVDELGGYTNVRDLSAVGLTALRQGDFQKARSTFREALGRVPVEDHATVAMIENSLGQVEEQAGQWDQAFEHYALSFRAATDASDQRRMVSVHINRGYLYALQGLYEEAKLECNAAIDILEALPDTPETAQLAMHAWMNLGNAHRHTQDYEAAASHYHQSLTLAEQNADQEAICHAMQHIGINLHLWGRAFRRDKRRMAIACQYQLEAWRYLTHALEMAQKADWRDAIAHGLNRLAKVYRETDRLRTTGPEYTALPDVAQALAALQREIEHYDMPFEAGYESRLLFPGSFAQLDWLRKAARLFELSALTAVDAHHYYRALDSLTEFATLLLELKYFDLVPQVVQSIEHMQGNNYQEQLLGALCDIIRGDCHCEQGEYDAALEAYRQGYTHLAQQKGYASHILNDRLWNLAWRFRAQLPHELIAHWCDILEMEWLSQKVLTARPDMLRMLENLRLLALR